MEFDYYAALGVTEEGTESVSDGTEGVNDTGVTDPDKAAEEVRPDADTGTDEGNNAEAGTEEKNQDEDGGTPEKTAQSKEDNARFAAARRKAEAERDAAVARAQEEAKAFAEKAVAEVLGTARFTNPYTGKPIRTKAEFDEYAEAMRREEQETFAENSGMSKEEYDAFIASRPEVLEAKRAKEEADAIINRARAKEAQEKIMAQIEEISSLNPAIRSIEDLSKLDTYPEIYEKVKKGYSISDAYKLTNLAEIEARAAERARQETRNSMQSKGHLERTGSRGTGAADVPADVKAEYRMLMPGATDEEIQKHYASYQKR